MTFNSPTPEFIFKLYDFKNPDTLSDIYQRCFGTKPSPGYFKWKYEDNPAGKAIAFVAMYNDTIAGFYGVIPELYAINGKVKTIYQSMDTMTHPDYRRMGLFTKLANITYDYLREKDGQIHLIGFPGEMSLSGFVDKLHWTPIIRIEYLFTYNFLYKSVTMFRSFTKYDIEEIDSFGEEFDAYFNRKEVADRPISKHINRAIANWRLTGHPNIHYKIARIMHNHQLIGYFSYRLDEKGSIFLVNVDVISTELFSACLNAICRYLFLKEKIKNVYTFQSGKNLRDEYYKSGFFTNPFSKGPFSYRTPFIVYGDKEISGLDWFDPDNFYIQPIVRDY